VISQTAEYALRAAVDLSYHHGERRATPEISQATKVPGNYLAKVLKSLARAGILDAHRGVRGGYTLARSPDRITLLEILNAVDPVQRIDACPLGHPAHRHDLCPLHRRLDDAMREVEHAFAQTTLAEVTAPPPRSGDGVTRRPATLTISGGLAPRGSRK